jgi:hypothetical protein
VPTSYHLIGRAIDVQRRPGVTHQTIDTALRKAGLVVIESFDESDHSHFAFATTPLRSAVEKSAVAKPAEPTSKPVGPQLVADDHGVLITVSLLLDIDEQP